MKSKITAVLLTLMVLPGAHALDNTTLKSLTVVAGLLTSSFAIYNYDQLDCRSNWQLGYQYGKDKELTSYNLNLAPLDCKMRRVPLLPQAIGFQVLPIISTSFWNADFGPYARKDYALAVIPIGRYGLQVGVAVLDFSVGLGPTLISETDIGMRQKSTNFQFSDEMGIGISDLSQRARLSFTYRHVSNADIRLPNNGVDFLGFGLTLKID
jgi:hypothetical protein